MEDKALNPASPELQVQVLDQSTRNELFVVVDCTEGEVFSVLADAIEKSSDALISTLAIIRPVDTQERNVLVDRLEKHPYSAQSFLPLCNGSSLVVVCREQEDGVPDLSTLQVFACPPGLGIIYRRGVWHKSVTALQDRARFAMFMHKTGCNDDTEFFDLPVPFSIDLHRIPKSIALVVSCTPSFLA